MAVVVSAAATCGACSERQPVPYLITAPTPVQTTAIAVPPDAASLRWDSAAELAEWVSNPLTEGPYALAREGDVDFAHAELSPGVSSRLQGPRLDPPFTGFSLGRVRVRSHAAPGDTASGLNNVGLFVEPAGGSVGILMPSYFAQAGGDASTWRIIELPPESGRGYPPRIDALWAYLSIGRRGSIGIDIDWIEFVR